MFEKSPVSCLLLWGYFSLIFFWPFSDNLELGNNKKAIQEADKVLKKNPNMQCARALKALALLRLGREEEAGKLEKELVDEKPCDVSTLQVLTFYYRETEECK